MKSLKTLQTTIFLFFMFSFLQGCGQGKVRSKSYDSLLTVLLNHSVPEVSVDSVKNDGDSVIFLDSREKEEFNVSHIKGAKWVEYKQFDLESVDSIPKDQKVVVYCSVGKRSEDIAKKLKDEGYSNVHNLYGGIFEWVNQGNPVYRGEHATDSVHAFSRTWGIWLNKGEKVYKGP